MEKITREQALALIDQIFGLDFRGENGPYVQRSPAVRAWFAAHLGNELLPDDSTSVAKRVAEPAARLMREVTDALCIEPVAAEGTNMAAADLLAACAEVVHELDGEPTLNVALRRRREEILRRANDAMANFMRQPVDADAVKSELLVICRRFQECFSGCNESELAFVDISEDLMADLRDVVARATREPATAQGD